MAERQQPWGKWYWGDWRKDARLRRCCYGARGLWADMLSLMGGECDRFGFLMMEGQALGPSDLVGLLGGALREVTKLLAELGDKRVYSRTGDPDLEPDLKALVPSDIPSGVIFSRRMLRDKAKAERDRENGKGGGNPRLNPTSSHDGYGVNPPDKAQKPEARNQKPEQDSPAVAAFDLGPPSENPEKSTRKKIRTSLPDDFPPDRLQHWAIHFWREKGRMDLCQSVQDEIEKFRDHATKRDEKYADWTAAWRNWCRNALTFNKGVSHGTAKKTAQQSFAASLSRSIQGDPEERSLSPGGGEIIDITPSSHPEGDHEKAA